MSSAVEVSPDVSSSEVSAGGECVVGGSVVVDDAVASVAGALTGVAESMSGCVGLDSGRTMPMGPVALPVGGSMGPSSIDTPPVTTLLPLPVSWLASVPVPVC